MESIREYLGENFINQEMVMEWLSELMVPYLNAFGFIAYGNNKKFKLETKDYKQVITLYFNNYQWVAYVPHFRFSFTDKNLEKDFKLKWTKAGFEYKSSETFWCEAFFHNDNPNDLSLELGPYQAIDNKEKAIFTFEKFKFFFEKYANNSLEEFKSPSSYIDYVNLKTFLNPTSRENIQKQWKWCIMSLEAEQFKRYVYYNKYHKEVLQEVKNEYYEKFKINNWILTEERRNEHELLFLKMTT
ncbi:hypothetical protein EZJ43_16770 [Pedobacter changchengzhani]|uniref:DUF4304 domain-containing protein n=1 Tax=Pedobacter changchengzhani TaxID=2529274 RepID=A0A4R5MH12_9SPHI|nr:hypothetical protein [Pedobacter changchengzhani]TDG34798.1 hypothetical protein EZJ43_16770 [Pedobacter changchengzhani]